MSKRCLRLVGLTIRVCMADVVGSDQDGDGRGYLPMPSCRMEIHILSL